MRYAVMLLMLGLFTAALAMPAQADEEVATQPIVGSWLLSGMKIDGEVHEDDDVIGSRRMVFGADGTMQAFNGDQLDDAGWYEAGQEQGTIATFRDLNGNGELDVAEFADPEIMSWSREDNELTLSIQLMFGDEPGPLLEATFTLVE